MTGAYRFWIAGDDGTELLFSASGSVPSATRIAYRNSASGYQDWTARSSQQSSSFNLTAGQVCYLEARQKEATGGDHLAVAWEIRDASTAVLVSREVIPGRFLSPHFLAPPQALQNLAGSVDSAGVVTLSWNEPAGGTVQSYRIKRALQPGGDLVTLGQVVSGLSFVDTGAAPNRSYSYVVSAVNDAGESPDTAPFELERDGYLTWLAESGLEEGAVASGFEEDADGDGIANGAEYMLSGPVSLIAGDGLFGVSAIVRDDPGVGVVLETSVDMVTWASAPVTLAADQTDVPPGYKRVTAALAAAAPEGEGGAAGFCRLRFSR